MEGGEKSLLQEALCEFTSAWEFDFPLPEFWQLFLFNLVLLRLMGAKVMSQGNN